MKRLKALLSCAAVSLAMYTRLPMPHLHWTIERMKYALGFFPLAGVLCGGAQALFLLLVRTTGVFGPSFRAAVLLALPIAVSGGIHLDGFCDVCDAAASHKSRQEQLEILKDSHCGAFAIIDLDDFKQVNDRYGHLSGDTVLADVAQHLCGAFRKGDLICRWGGDEFVVYCEDMERDDIERRLVELSEGPWNATLPDNRVIELSVSTGIAMVPQDGIAFKTVYERADRALYRAKSKGKAHFCFFEADKDS